MSDDTWTKPDTSDAQDAEIIEPAPTTNQTPTKRQQLPDNPKNRKGLGGFRKSSKFDPDVADYILTQIADGDSLRAATRKLKEETGNAVSPQTILYWSLHNRDFAEQFAEARMIGWALMAEEILDIADGNLPNKKAEHLNGAMIPPDEDDAKERWRRESNAVQRDRLRADTRRWILSKMLPKIYGDREVKDGEARQNRPLVVSWLDSVER